MTERRKSSGPRLTGALMDRMEAEARALLSREHAANPCPTASEVALEKLRLKHPVMAEMGRIGGRKGGRVKAERMTPEERHEEARQRGFARWAGITRRTPQELLEKKRAKARRWQAKRQAKVNAARVAAGLPIRKRGRPRKTIAKAEAGPDINVMSA